MIFSLVRDFCLWVSYVHTHAKHFVYLQQQNAIIFHTSWLIIWFDLKQAGKHSKFTLSSYEVFKMIFAEHSSNNGKNKVAKKSSWHGNNLDTAKKNLSRLKLSS